jgi:magnesium transporter
LKRNKNTKKKIGLPPGSIIYTGVHESHVPVINVFKYNENEFEEREFTSSEKLVEILSDNTVSWINVNGIHNIELIKQFEQEFNVHSLLLEDIANINQRPKIEDFGDYLFFSLKMLSYNNETKEIDNEQISFILGKNFLLSFQEKPGDVFDTVRDRIRNAKGNVREKTADFLCYLLVDIIVDNYFQIIEAIGDEIDELEDIILLNPEPENLQSIQKNKKQLLQLRKAIYPLREAIYKLVKNEFLLIDKKTIKYFNDVYDHTVQVIETIESQRDMNTGLKDIYLSGLSIQMNKVMQVLTLVATIFIPLTFIVGIYGMNFENMPELTWKYGYFIIMAFMFAIAFALVIFFKKKKWI